MFKSEGFATQGGTEDCDQESLYDRPISPFFDLQGGVRYDLDSLAGRGWAALGEGLAPYLFELSATLYASDVGLRLRYEISRKFAPYFGGTYQRAYGPAVRAGLAAFDNNHQDAWRVAVGARIWL